MFRAKHRVSYFILGFLILSTAFVLLGLPNGKFSWTAVAQYFGGDLPANVNNRYISNAGVQVFLNKQNTVEVWGACYQSGAQTKCNEIARFALSSLKPGKSVPGEVLNRQDRDTKWRVVVFHLGTENNVNSFQINVYDGGGGLVDDRLVIKTGGIETVFTTR